VDIGVSRGIFSSLKYEILLFCEAKHHEAGMRITIHKTIFVSLRLQAWPGASIQRDTAQTLFASGSEPYHEVQNEI
jgi:hypothetical protein